MSWLDDGIVVRAYLTFQLAADLKRLADLEGVERCELAKRAIVEFIARQTPKVE